MSNTPFSTAGQIPLPVFGIAVALLPSFFLALQCISVMLPLSSQPSGAILGIGVTLPASFQLRTRICKVGCALLSSILFTYAAFGFNAAGCDLSAKTARGLAAAVDPAIVPSHCVSMITNQLNSTSPAHVFLMGDGFQVIGINATSHPAFVVQFRGFNGDLSNEGQIRQHMGKLDMFHTVTLPIGHTVSTFIKTPHPNPAPTIRLRDATFPDDLTSGLGRRRDVRRKSAKSAIQAHPAIIRALQGIGNTTLSWGVL